MSQALGRLQRLALDCSGLAAIEFAMVMPVFILMLVGGMYMAMLGFTAASLNYATEAAARCASLASTTCSTSTTTSTFATSRYMSLSNAVPSFISSNATCGHLVTGSITFVVNTGLKQVNVPLTSSACFP